MERFSDEKREANAFWVFELARLANGALPTLSRERLFARALAHWRTKECSAARHKGCVDRAMCVGSMPSGCKSAQQLPRVASSRSLHVCKKHVRQKMDFNDNLTLKMNITVGEASPLTLK